MTSRFARSQQFIIAVFAFVLGLTAPAATIWIPGGTATGVADNTSNGSVGIGTSTPYSGTGVTSLTINATSYPIVAMQYSGTYIGWFTGHSDHLNLMTTGSRYLSFDTNETERMRITSGGNIGIGTTSPYETANFTSVDVRGSTGGALSLGSTSVRTGILYSYSGGTVVGSVNSAPLVLATADIERMRIDVSGNAGIGTTSPSAKLDISQGTAGSWGLKVRNTSTGSASALIWGFADSADAGSSLLDIGNPAGAQLYFQGNGRLGIGTTTPDHSLHVVGNIYSTSGIIGTTLWTSDAIRKLTSSTALSFRNSGGVAEMTLDASGNLGIGTTSPSHKLAVNGTVRAKEVIVDTGWSDYVFADDYRLAPLSEVESHIKAKKHLPGIPSAAEVEQGGVSIGDMQARLLAKVEELTLHVIAQEKRMAAVEHENAELRAEVRRVSPLQ
jgi:hypothetical protein